MRVAAVWEAFLVALSSLRSNKLRTALTLMGIVVGVAAVIAVVTIIKGLDQTVAATFSSQGSTVFTISKRPRVITSREDFIKFNKRKDVGKGRIGLLINETERLVGQILAEFHGLPKRLQGLPPAVASDMQAQFQVLIHKRFVAETGALE